MPPAKPDDGQLEQATESLADIDQTIHAPTRLKILAVLRVVERADFTFILNQTGSDPGQPFGQSTQTRGSRVRSHREDLRRTETAHPHQPDGRRPPGYSGLPGEYAIGVG